jgi:hypothetical protein
MPRPSAAESLFPHLPHRSDVVAKRQEVTLAEAMYPRQARPPSNNPYSDRDSLLRNLRELNARIDARLEGERRS